MNLRTRRPWFIGLVASALLSDPGLGGAAPVPACGTFSVNHENVPDFARANDGNPFHGQHVTITFKFDPSRCHAACTCNRIAFVQVVKFVRWDGGATVGTDFQVDPWQSGRCTGDPVPGWAVDKLSAGGRRYGFYARRDDGTFPPAPPPQGPITFDPPVQVGSNTQPAILFDSPGVSTGVSNDFGFFAVTAPVCIDDQSACNDQVLGHADHGLPLARSPAHLRQPAGHGRRGHQDGAGADGPQDAHHDAPLRAPLAGPSAGRSTAFGATAK